jgi:hypothetical protein
MKSNVAKKTTVERVAELAMKRKRPAGCILFSRRESWQDVG